MMVAVLLAEIEQELMDFVERIFVKKRHRDENRLETLYF